MKNEEQDAEPLFRVFEDLLENVEKFDDGDIEETPHSDDDTLVPKTIANSFTLKGLIKEMEKRGLQPRGFFAEDAKLLQIHLDREYDEYIQTKQEEKRLALERQIEERAVRKRARLIASEMNEELLAVQSDIKFVTVANLILQGIGPNHIRVHVNRITVKTLARLLWSQHTERLISLDLSGMNLSDTDGSYIARALKNNRILKRLDLSENNLGSRCCTILSDSLSHNNVLESLNLDSNPLCQNDLNGFRLFTSMLRGNKGLRCVRIWRCQTGMEFGKMLASVLEDNITLLSVDVGYNNWNYKDVQSVEHALVRTDTS
jgi:hypothetical protein